MAEKNEQLSALAGDLDSAHETVLGLLDALENLIQGDATTRAVTCAMHHYLDGLHQVIEKVQGFSKEVL